MSAATSGRQYTLRAAVQQANKSSGADTISPVGRLPETTTPVTIDGYTQPGSGKNGQAVGTNAVLNIALDGSRVLEDPYVEPASGLKLKGPGASNSVIRGLVESGVSLSIPPWSPLRPFR